MWEGIFFWRKPPHKSVKQKKQELEKTAKAVHTILETGYISHGRIYRINFIRGIFFGLGSALGATVILTSFVYFLSFFDSLPLIGGVVDTINNSLNNK